MSHTCGRATFLGAILLATAPAVAQAPQSHSTSQRNYDGWQTAAKTAADAGAKQAYFQSPANGSQGNQLPSLPSGFGAPSLPEMPGLPSNGLPQFPADASNDDWNNPVQQAGGAPAFDAFAHPGGQLTATDVRQASDSGLRNSAGGSQPVYPPQVLPQQSFNGQVLPPQNSLAPQGSLRSVSQQTTATYNTIAQQQFQQQQQQQFQPQQQQQLVHNGSPYSIPIVSQDPRFVSPPPTPRVGNFATSPYQPYRLAAYQVNQQLPAQRVQAPLAQPNQPQFVTSTSSLPQFQPIVGIHPTAYQTGYQYCAPTIPSNGVPQVVPGAVVPPTLPPNLTPQLYTPDNSGYKPLFSLGQENYNVLLGRGVIGQPTVYVPGQPVRNFIRYISP